MALGRVFVVHEPLDRELGRTKDIEPARRYGNFHYLVRSGPTPSDLTGLLPQMERVLCDYTSNDYILPIGHPVLIGWAVALAARAAGQVNMLYWRNGYYDVITAELGEPKCLMPLRLP